MSTISGRMLDNDNDHDFGPDKCPQLKSSRCVNNMTVALLCYEKIANRDCKMTAFHRCWVSRMVGSIGRTWRNQHVSLHPKSD